MFALIPEDQLAHQPKVDYWYESEGGAAHHQVLGWLNLLQMLRSIIDRYEGKAA